MYVPISLPTHVGTIYLLMYIGIGLKILGNILKPSNLVVGRTYISTTYVPT